MRETDTTRPIGAVFSWESYCAAVGVDPVAARRATLTGALWSLLGGKREAPLPRFDVEPSEAAPDTSRPRL